MANHAQVYHCKEKFNKSRLFEIAQDFCKTFTKGIFEAHKCDGEPEEGGYMYIVAVDANKKERDYLLINFFMGEYLEDENGEKKTPAAEIRHGHFGPAHDFLWWLDRELLIFFADQLQGNMYDDGVGPIDDYLPKMNTLQEYIEALHTRMKQKAKTPKERSHARMVKALKMSEAKSAAKVFPFLKPLIYKDK